MRLLIAGDAAGTGFGTVTRDLGSALLARGIDVRFLTLNESPAETKEEPFVGRVLRFGTRQGWLRGISQAEYERLSALMRSDVELMPSDRATLAEIHGVYERMSKLFTEGADEDGWIPETALVIGDVASLKMSHIADFIPDSVPAFHYVPIEGANLPPRWAMYWQKLRPIAMTEFGAGEIERITGTRPPVAYHGVDPSAFWPVSAFHPIKVAARKEIAPGHYLNTTIDLQSKQACKEFVAHGAATLTNGRSRPDPRKLWILRADRNMPRKAYPSLLRSLSAVLDRHPDVEFLHHCRSVDEGGDLDDDKSHFPEHIRNRMLSTGWHDSPEYMGATRNALNAIYNAADIYVSSGAEGFGLTIAEAMACGVPAVGLDYSSVPEVIGDAGLLVPVGGYIDNPYAHLWARPDESAFADAISRLIRSRAARRVFGAKGTERVRAMFTWPAAAKVIADLLLVREEVAA